jgi:uncharacterized protein (TIGR04255 family)
MTTVARPPVNEVVISISFQPQPVLEGPRLLIGLSRILADFPQVTEVPPYGMPAEQPFEEQVLQPAVPQIQFVSSPQTQRRYWLTESESSSLLLQIQSNYFALNWRQSFRGSCHRSRRRDVDSEPARVDVHQHSPSRRTVGRYKGSP